MSVQTFLIEDPRISKSGNNKVIVGVKSGPASSVVQKYVSNSSSLTNTLFNINVPSENTLVDRHILIEGSVSLQVTVTAHTTDDTHIDIIPSAFPFNQLLQSASMQVNNSKVNVFSEDVLNMALKQFDQRYLSKHCQGTANYVDKYYSNMNQMVGSSSPFESAIFGEKDSDTVGRVNVKAEMYELNDQGVRTTLNIFGTRQKIVKATNKTVYELIFHFVEPIIGLPSTSMQENDGCYSGLTQLELSFQYTAYLKRAINVKISSDANGSPYKGILAIDVQPNGSYLLDKDAKAIFRYYSLHPSQYAKLSKKTIIPFDELTTYKTVVKKSPEILSNVISLRQIPDKLYIFVRPKASDKPCIFSNALCYPISRVTIGFNNVAGLLSDMNQNDLYLMSRRNGSQQTYQEFIGKMLEASSIGSYVVVDVTRDLGLDDMLSASSLGQFSLQVNVTYDDIHEYNLDVGKSVELCVVANYSGLLVTEQGSSSTMSGLLTKQSVLDAKSKGGSNIDYDDVTEISGGNLFKSGKSEIGHLIKSERGRIAQALDSRLDGAVDSGANKIKTVGHDKLQKYY